jgi:hypothetical protein
MKPSRFGPGPRFPRQRVYWVGVVHTHEQCAGIALWKGFVASTKEWFHLHPFQQDSGIRQI